MDFNRLADQWEHETVICSSVHQMVSHPAYQEIIGLGWDCVPLILGRLAADPNHWFWALARITGVDPAMGEETVPGAARAWLKWGRIHGYIK